MIPDKSIATIAQEYIPYAQTLEKVGSFAVLLLDKIGNYYYISKVFEEPQGNTFLSWIHPEDREIIKQIDTQVWELLYEMPVEERLQYKFIYEFRILDKQKYIRVIYQQQLLAFEGNNCLAMSIMDASPEQDTTLPVHFQIKNCLTEELLPFTFKLPTDVQLTPREKEVLLLANEGMFSKEISEKLSISVHTVNRHRQNILEKTHADNIVEAIAFAKRMRLIE
ncbi:MAG: helix-turn-helix transcriptional regulator [Capnocytophaga sp.]|nr:helix-turn-helix transcriptional regulator [Capnocytophaga sp.]